ncbi:hypothetical protein [Paenibacillus sp.]|uniref:hypothetical protein n=1 Tax=Paenibacillus sp. TaxID=58172 RepID=UPI0028A5E391|nr:hypothetical protein [Paenibacillus sp.]
MNVKKNVLFISFIFVIVVIIGWITIEVGHSKWNFERQLNTNLQRLQTINEVNYSSDADALKEIALTKHPLKIKVLSITPEVAPRPDYFRDVTVEINDKPYKVRMACYTKPLSNTPFEIWDLNQINYE